MTDQEAFDENLDEVVESEAIKKALEEPEKIVETEPTFKREMVAFDQIHRFLYSLMEDAIKMSGEYVDSLAYFEEQLTPAEYFTLEAFYKWVEAGEMSDDPINEPDSREFGSGNYQERYNEWLATLPNIDLSESEVKS